MSDDLKIKKPLDSSLINIHEVYEVNWWCKDLNCSKVKLIAAVKTVGTSAPAVRKYLGK